MNILLENGLPEEYEGVEISADFRNMIRADIILRDPELSNFEKTACVLQQLYPEIPADIQFAIHGWEWFFLRGEEKNGNGKQSNAKRGFDFDQDDSLIYAAFYAAYGISLTTVDFLHWWEFMALFEGLPDTALMKRVIYWRTAELSKLPKAEKKHVSEMRALFRLKGPDREPVSLEEVERQTLDMVARRFAEANRQAGN